MPLRTANLRVDIDFYCHPGGEFSPAFLPSQRNHLYARPCHQFHVIGYHCLMPLRSRFAGSRLWTCFSRSSFRRHGLKIGANTFEKKSVVNTNPIATPSTRLCSSVTTRPGIGWLVSILFV